MYTKHDYDGKYMDFRRIVENNLRSTFIEKGEKPVRRTPLYCILGVSHDKNYQSYKEWYTHPEYIEIVIHLLKDTVSVVTQYDESISRGIPIIIPP